MGFPTKNDNFGVFWGTTISGNTHMPRYNESSGKGGAHSNPEPVFFFRGLETKIEIFRQQHQLRGVCSFLENLHVCSTLRDFSVFFL